MNIIEAYIKFNSQLIIVISGIHGCGKSSVAKRIAKDLNLKWLDQHDYYDKTYNKTVTLSDDTTLVNLSTDDAIDWDSLNKSVNATKSKGLVVSGMSFPKDKIKFEPDYHLHISLSKQNCIQKRKEFLEKHKDKYPEDYARIGSTTETLKMNKLIYPYYMETVKNMAVNKFINANKFSKDEVIVEAWTLAITFIQQFVDWFNENKYWDWKKLNPETTKPSIPKSEPEYASSDEYTSPSSSSDRRTETD